MKVTVCQTRNALDDFTEDWEQLREHVTLNKSELVVLPEMPFYPWLATTKNFDERKWNISVKEHDKWIKKLHELSPATVLGSRPTNRNNQRINEGFMWDKKTGYQATHVKYYLPNSRFFWEASWYERGAKKFSSFNFNKTKLGMMICTDIWFTEHARKYAKNSIHLLICPRATPDHSIFNISPLQNDIWLAAGRVAARMSGAFCLSSNRGGESNGKLKWEGGGWIIHPAYGEVLAVTSNKNPFITLDINLSDAEIAKTTYPRYVQE